MAVFSCTPSGMGKDLPHASHRNVTNFRTVLAAVRPGPLI